MKQILKSIEYEDFFDTYWGRMVMRVHVGRLDGVKGFHVLWSWPLAGY